MSETILKKLREEHQRVREIMENIAVASDIVRKKELYLQARNELLPHMEGEEKTIYAHLIEDVGDEEAEEVANDAKYEHEQMRNLIEKMDNISIESDEWDSTFRELQGHFLDHIRKEESVLFAEAREDFSTEELIEFADEFEEAKLHTSP